VGVVGQVRAKAVCRVRVWGVLVRRVSAGWGFAGQGGELEGAGKLVVCAEADDDDVVGAGGEDVVADSVGEFFADDAGGVVAGAVDGSPGGGVGDEGEGAGSGERVDPAGVGVAGVFGSGEFGDVFGCGAGASSADEGAEFVEGGGGVGGGQGFFAGPEQAFVAEGEADLGLHAVGEDALAAVAGDEGFFPGGGGRRVAVPCVGVE